MKQVAEPPITGFGTGKNRKAVEKQPLCHIAVSTGIRMFKQEILRKLMCYKATTGM